MQNNNQPATWPENSRKPHADKVAAINRTCQAVRVSSGECWAAPEAVALIGEETLAALNKYDESMLHQSAAEPLVTFPSERYIDNRIDYWQHQFGLSGQAVRSAMYHLASDVLEGVYVAECLKGGAQ